MRTPEVSYELLVMLGRDVGKGIREVQRLSPIGSRVTPEMGSVCVSSISRRIRRDRWSDISMARSTRSWSTASFQ